ncbi:MAG: TetR/AcrR family transcriptional regulator [Acidimicrobiales bacterium]
MGRPSVKEERIEEILDAVQACVVEHGLAGTTMARIAARAGMQPSAINHFIGTRDKVVEAALERSTQYYEELIDSIEQLPVAEILDRLVGAASRRRSVRPEAMVLFDEMLTLAPRDARVADRVRHAMTRLADVIDRQLAVEHPDAATADRKAVATSTMLMIDNLERLVVIGVLPARSRSAVRRSIDALIGTLDD